MRVFSFLFTLVFLGGCASNPSRPENRNEWEAIHKKTFTGVTQEEILQAAEEVLKLADSDFIFEYPTNTLIARRNWFIYAVLAAVNGQDYWKVEVDEELGEVTVIVRATRQESATTPSPVVGLANGNISGASVQSNTLPGAEIYWGGPYRIFWSRLDYMLGRTDIWLKCPAADQPYPTDFAPNDTGVLCGVTTDDNVPKKHESPPS